MASTVTREAFDELADEVAGEKVVTRHILEQARQNGDDLAVLKTRVSRVEEKLDGLDRKVDGLLKDLPRIIGEAMRSVLAERNGKK